MPFKRENDVINKRTSRVIKVFAGYHSGFGKTDQPDDYGYICDFDCRFRVLDLREGLRKNESSGYTSSLVGIMNIRLGGGNKSAIVNNGAMTIYDTVDILAGV